MSWVSGQCLYPMFCYTDCYPMFYRFKRACCQGDFQHSTSGTCSRQQSTNPTVRDCRENSAGLHNWCCYRNMWIDCSLFCLQHYLSRSSSSNPHIFTACNARDSDKQSVPALITRVYSSITKTEWETYYWYCQCSFIMYFIGFIPF